MAFERRAVRLIGRPDVRAALDRLAETWRRGSPGFLPETEAQLRPSIEEVVLLVALQVVNGDPRRPGVVEISAGPHLWGGTEVPGGRWGINNPDTLYFAIPIEPGARYVVTGLRHADGPIDLNASVQVPDVWATLENLGARDLAIEPDGTYRITLDDEPAGDRRNHLRLREGGSVLLIRQTLADWSRAVPDRLTVARLDGPPPSPPLSDDELASQVIERLAAVIAHNVNTLQPPVFRYRSTRSRSRARRPTNRDTSSRSATRSGISASPTTRRWSRFWPRAAPATPPSRRRTSGASRRTRSGTRTASTATRRRSVRTVRSPSSSPTGTPASATGSTRVRGRES